MPQLSQKTFRDLHDKLFQKFKTENNGVLPATVTQKYGINEFASNDVVPSLRRSLSEHPGVIKYFEGVNNGIKSNESGFKKIETKRWLYEPNVAITKKKAPQKIQVDDDQYNAWIIYLESVDHGQQLETTEEIEYSGFYYSYKENTIFEANFYIDFTQSPISVRMSGFHQRAPFELSGTGRIERTYFYASLTGKRQMDWDDEFHLIAKIGNQTRPDLLCASFLGVSSYDYPTSGEIVLVTDTFSSKEDINIIKQYLTLKKSRLKSKYFDDTNGMMVKGKYLNEISHMVGFYQVLNFNPVGDLMISRFTIDEFYNSRFITTAYNANQNNQVCLLNISSVLTNRLCISTHPNLGTGIIAYVMINIPRKGEKFNKGVFCSVGQTGNMPVAGNIVLEMVNYEVEPMRVNKDEIQQFLQDNPDMQLAFNELVKLERRKPPSY